jgi:membrane protein implicated in regulation of membrane protease activity
MSSSLQHLAWWHWWILAAVLAALETVVPGAIVIWFGVSAFVVGALLLMLPVPVPLQIVLFGVLGVVSMLIWRRLKNPEEGESTQPTLNQRGVHYIGQVYTLVEPIVSGTGKIQVGDTVWLARGGDAPVGARVRVIGVDGAVLQVESA